jgi:hypothetical protein
MLAIQISQRETIKCESCQLNKEREIIQFSEVGKVYGKNESSIHEIMEKEKVIHTSFDVASQNAKVIAAEHKCLVKIEKALHM